MDFLVVKKTMKKMKTYPNFTGCRSERLCFIIPTYEPLDCNITLNGKPVRNQMVLLYSKI